MKHAYSAFLYLGLGLLNLPAQTFNVSGAVIDGDTFPAVSGSAEYKVRVFGLDAFEKDQPGGTRAKNALAKLASWGARLECRKHGTSHERIVMQCTGKDGDLAEALLRAGHGYVWTAEREQAADWLAWRPKAPGKLSKTASLLARKWHRDRQRRYLLLVRYLDAEREAADALAGGWSQLAFGEAPQCPPWKWRHKQCR